MIRQSIIKEFAEWAAFSATRSGCPVKSRKELYPLIREPRYSKILEGDRIITAQEFDEWHKENTIRICDKNARLPVGWGTKLINMYLKTLVYIAREGRKGLIECIHPPIDSWLWKGIKKVYNDDNDIIEMTHVVTQIKDITSYEIYQKIIDGCRLIAQRRGCLLIELEELRLGIEI
ncbi:MAG: hypothetical protein ACTSYB_02065 [Candidatus Helarchaeota archaeon]